MDIAGLQKMTLLDFPGKVACTVFLQGCNFRCPFCHNSDLLSGTAPAPMSTAAFLSFLQKRQGLLDGVCITGGEPTLQPDLEQLIRDIKALGFAVKLDTNGTRPLVLQRLISEQLVDYVAMDVKNSPTLYGDTIGRHDFALDEVEQSLQLLLRNTVDYELRTTVVDELHNEQAFLEIGEWLHRLSPEQKAVRFFLQAYVDRDNVLCSGLHAPSVDALQRYAARLAPYVETVSLRGVDL